MKQFNRREIAKGLAALLAASAFLPASAQDTPARILVGFPAGGSFDTIARILADKLKTELNRPVVVDNKPGAGGRIAVDHLKSAPADGSVLMLGPDALSALYPFTFRKLSYDPKKDLVPVGTVAEFPFAMAAGADPKVATLAEYVAWARKNPQKANYGIPALGAPHHFYGMVLGDAIGVPMQNVPFLGSAPIALALMGGQISSGIDVVSSLVENHRAGKIRMLAVTSEARVPQAPDVPTFAELGYPNITGMGFNALYAPPQTPAAAIATWNKAVAKVLAMPDVKEKLFTMGFLPVGKSPEELVERSAQAAKRWEPVIKASGFVAD
jgi:tripartite-type tricarboxylate transporter receptor subunit TctC